MKKLIQVSLMFLMLLVASCSNSKKDTNSQITEKKTKLAKLVNDKNKLDAEIKKLEAELALIDTASTSSSKIKLVSIAPVSTGKFEHFIDLQGMIDAENISYISPRGMPSQVKAVYVKQGQPVRKGQLLLKLDDAILQQQVVVARQQLQGIRTRLNLARSLYERQQNLWSKGIGTEVQVLQAKTEVEGLEAQLRSANESIQAAVVQANTSNVYSDVNGIADLVNIRVGEIFNGGTPMNPQIKIVNTSSLKVVSSVPENYISRMKTGTPVVVNVPDLNKKINTSISLISQSIDPTQRGFIAEAKIPYDPSLKPNQTAIMKILDYSAANAVIIPVNVVQTDENGKYVYVLEKLSNGKTIAKKKRINIGEVYGDNVEVKTGLTAGEQLITEGYQNLYEGQMIGTQL
jgi:RND family efflux transporter MFP subunit